MIDLYISMHDTSLHDPMQRTTKARSTHHLTDSTTYQSHDSIALLRKYSFKALSLGLFLPPHISAFQCQLKKSSTKRPCLPFARALAEGRHGQSQCKSSTCPVFLCSSKPSKVNTQNADVSSLRAFQNNESVVRCSGLLCSSKPPKSLVILVYGLCLPLLETQNSHSVPACLFPSARLPSSPSVKVKELMFSLALASQISGRNCHVEELRCARPVRVCIKTPSSAVFLPKNFLPFQVSFQMARRQSECPFSAHSQNMTMVLSCCRLPSFLPS